MLLIMIVNEDENQFQLIECYSFENIFKYPLTSILQAIYIITMN